MSNFRVNQILLNRSHTQKKKIIISDATSEGCCRSLITVNEKKKKKKGAKVTYVEKWTDRRKSE